MRGWVRGRAMVRLSAWLNSLSPATEKDPIINTRISQTITATNIGTTLRSICLSMTTFPRVSWLSKAIEIPHQVNMAFMVAASSQAPKRYHTSPGSSAPSSGVKRRAIPAKSIPQNATARIVAQLTPRKSSSPRRSRKANSVVL